MTSAVKSLVVGALLAAPAPIVAQPIVVTNGVDHPAIALPRIVDVPGYGTVVVVPQLPKESVRRGNGALMRKLRAKAAHLPSLRGAQST